uniref:TSL-kinase interacting protein 1 n=1 Tax=Kalanchoe fedtschenkoi TaxID=63787 RepID=A0A7N0TB70_KALFE
MMTELQTTMTTSLDCGPNFLTLNCSLKDGIPGTCFSSIDHVETKHSAKKPTRQWAAWTRQEEESFFTALRQFGKNFEKITLRVQSKNKDQVRHYYYRLFRRMNKLLGPGISLDSKNSKETIAAMLRWWSLLEKYSCKASKLHLKPRRFKLFVEALEHQLVKDRKKSIKKKHSQGENCAPAASIPVGNQTRSLGTDSDTVKLVLIDSQNIQKLGSGKVTSSSPRCNVSLGVNRGNIKGDTSSVKMARQRKRPGSASATSYKRWEKAAMAGVSLVADAAEHLERAGLRQDSEQELGTNSFDHPGNLLPPLPHHQNAIHESNVQSSVKLKLQLFPIDEVTRRALEMDKLNPYLELTLSNRKKISSVLEHLTRKWGSSSVATGKLMLFPYMAKRENLVSYQRWGQDSCVSVGDINISIGNPAVFRLRYGWVSPETDCPSNQVCFSSDHAMNMTGQSHHASPDVQNNHGMTSNPAENTKLRTENVHASAESLKVGSTVAVSAGEWADSLTNMSIGDLLTEVSDEINDNAIEPPVSGNTEYYEQIPFTCDSFDAAIAAHISKHHNKTSFPSAFTSQSPSFFEAEDTCDAFSFRKKSNTFQDLSNIPETEAMQDGNLACAVDSDYSTKELCKVDNVAHSPQRLEVAKDLLEHTIIDDAVVAKDINGLTDLYWPDSLGPLDLEIPTCRYHSTDLILSDSLGGLSGLIASSLDAFQSCTFFGTEKKPGSPAADESHKTASFPRVQDY